MDPETEKIFSFLCVCLIFSIMFGAVSVSAGIQKEAERSEYSQIETEHSKPYSERNLGGSNEGENKITPKTRGIDDFEPEDDLDGSYYEDEGDF